ncbi:hypothetical protein Q669_31705 [Labrenzia sp. C1B10]|nr:hypothetical protein Q669_31705 [Labrenzia sp. C1B10]ERS06217.1 hypothetical protein Q675_28680 [Labrenzia sp. C1B70]
MFTNCLAQTKGGFRHALQKQLFRSNCTQANRQRHPRAPKPLAKQVNTDNKSHQLTGYFMRNYNNTRLNKVQYLKYSEKTQFVMLFKLS